MVIVVEPPVLCHSPSPFGSWCAYTVSVTVSPATGLLTVSVPVVTPLEQLSVMLAIVCLPLDNNGPLPMLIVL